MELLRDLINTFSDPRTAHAALGHMPIALSMLGIPLLIALLATRGRNPALRVTALGAYLLFAAGAWMAQNAGERAEGRVGELSHEVHELLEEHEELGELAPWLGLVTAVFAAGAWFKNPKLALASVSLSLVAAIFTSGWIAVTAHYGGRLVYEHGVGMPRKGGEAPSSAPADADPRLAAWRTGVQPLLAERCYGCHGDGGKPGGRLDLTTMEGMLKGGESGAAVVPGNAEKSLLWRAVAWQEEHLKMPLDEPQLSSAEIDTIRRWIEAGAVWAPAP